MRRKSADEVNSYLEEKELELVSKYVNSKTTLTVLHSVCGNAFEKTFNHLLHNPKCPFCNPPKTARKGLEIAKKLIAEKEGHVLLSDKYENQYTPLKIKCKKTNKIEVTYLKFFVKNGCKSCNKKRIEDNLDTFKIKKLEEIKNEMMKQNYTLLSCSYQSNKQKLEYLCPQGHEGTIKWNNWLTGARCLKCNRESSKGSGNPHWKGGLVERKLVSYKVFSPQLKLCETIRPDPEEPSILQAKCNYCGKWFRPTRSAVSGRIQALNGPAGGEVRLYCSKECKKECPIFWKRLYPDGFKKATSREVQPQLRQMVFERDKWACQKCGNDISLQCHHIESVSQNPIESADIDNCLTLCKRCHKWAHTEEGCRYFELRCLK